MARQRHRRYSETFKLGAIDLVQSGQPMAAVARQLGIPETTVQNWVYQHRSPGDVALPPPTDEPIDPALYRAALKRIHDLEVENEFLGKASTYFAQKAPG